MKSGVRDGGIVCFVLEGLCVCVCVCVLGGRTQQERGWRSVSLQLGRRGKATVQKSSNHTGIPTMLSLHELLHGWSAITLHKQGKNAREHRKEGRFMFVTSFCTRKKWRERYKGKERKVFKGSVWNAVRTHRFTESTRAEKDRQVSWW